MSETAIQDLLALLAISGPPGQEAAVARHLQEQLLVLGISQKSISVDNAQQQSPYGGETGNLIVRMDGHGRGPRRLFSAHMDTVPGAAGAQPRLDRAHDRVVNDAPGKALGGDDRTGCAVLLQIARALAARRCDHAPTTLVFFVQEEVGLVGARGLDVHRLGEPRPSLGFNFDGHDAGEFITAVTGTERFTIDIQGIPAHSGCNPQDGISAALVAAEALAQLERDGWHGPIAKAEGRGSANTGILRGGTGSNVVMPELHILAEARSHDRAFRRAIIEAWQRAFEGSASRHRNQRGATAEVRFAPGPTYEAYALAEDSPVVQMARTAAKRCEIETRLVRDDGGNDANWLVAHGVPTVTIGAGQREIHMPAEWIDLEQFRAACRLGVTLATD